MLLGLYHKNSYLLLDEKSMDMDCRRSINVSGINLNKDAFYINAIGFVGNFQKLNMRTENNFYIKFFLEFFQSLYNDYIDNANKKQIKYTISLFFENEIYYRDMRAVINMIETFFTSSECENINMVKRNHTDVDEDDSNA
ncbi:hypothetical protein COBT_003890, partial [Conglomerata obtusa]